jgi:hypothetical protein
MTKAQMAYNKLTSISSYILWISEENTLSGDAQEAMDICEVLKEDIAYHNAGIRHSIGLEYAMKWHGVFHIKCSAYQQGLEKGYANCTSIMGKD